MPKSEQPRKSKSAVINQDMLVRSVGGRKMKVEMAKTLRALNNGEVDFSFGLPPITDLDGKYEC